MDTLGYRLKQLREKHGYTLEYVASQLNTTKTSIGRYEKNDREPKAEMIAALAEFYNVSTDFLLKHKTIEVQQYKEKDIEKIIDELMEQQGLMLCGHPMNEDDLMLLRNSIRSTIEMAKNMKKK